MTTAQVKCDKCGRFLLGTVSLDGTRVMARCPCGNVIYQPVKQEDILP